MYSSYITVDGSNIVQRVYTGPDIDKPAGAIEIDPAVLASVPSPIRCVYTAAAGSAPASLSAPPAPALSLSQQAAAALAAGVTIVSEATPALNGTYACDDAAQSAVQSMYLLVNRSSPAAFPSPLTELPWADISGDPAKARVFASVTDWLNFEAKFTEYVLALRVIVTTNAGTLPAPTVNIP